MRRNASSSVDGCGCLGLVLVGYLIIGVLIMMNR